MQVSSSGQIYNGTGTQVTNLVLTSVTASFNGLINSASVAILANTAVSASVAATVTTAAQPSITSVGTLTGLGVEGNVSVTGTLTANTYILSSSVTSMTIEFASGSTAFGNTSDDTHKFIGSVTVTGSLVVSGSSTFRNIGPAQFTGSIIATQGFTGSLQGTATSASMASYVAGANVDGQVSDSNKLGGAVAANYALNTSITGFATTSSLTSYALSTAITGFATTSSLANYALATAITGFATTGSIGSAITSTTSTNSLITNTFYTVDSTSGVITITLRSNTAGAEFTFFATNLTNDIVFAAFSGVTIISEDSYLKMNKVGSAVTAKYYTSNTVALIGSLKA